MGAVEIVIIVLAAAVVVGFTVSYIVRKAKGKPTGSCASCPYAKDCKNCSGGCHSGNEKIDLTQYKVSREEDKKHS